MSGVGEHVIEEVVKRDGRRVPFDQRKVEAAVRACLRACWGKGSERVARGEDGAPALLVAQQAENILLGRHGDGCGVEAVQDAVEVAMLAAGLRAEARSYMAYRDGRAQARRAELVTGELRAAYEAGSAAMGNDPLRSFQFFDKYARWNGQRRETWPECVDRSMEFLRWLMVENLGGDRLRGGEWAELRAEVLSMGAMPSMRLLAMAGPAAQRDNIATFNCSFQVIDCLEAFHDSLLISMAGCGDGYSVEAQFVRRLPFVQHQRGGVADSFVVPDSAEGWGQALTHGLTRWFGGHDCTFDFSEVRAAGTPLRVKGGKASGPRPLRDLLAFLRKIVLSRQGSQLRPVDVNDMMTMTGTAGNSGGMRRAAKISLSDWGDDEMEHAKDGEFWRRYPWREYANNSAVWPDGGPTQLDLVRQMEGMMRSGSGERGIFSRANALRMMPSGRRARLTETGESVRIGVNPCGEVVLRDQGLCNLSICVARQSDIVADLRRKVRVASILGTIQSLATHFPYIRLKWAQNAREERLLGVDVTGQMDCPASRDAGVLRGLREVVRATNQEFALRFGINVSASTTVCKPSGNSSVLLDCAPGIHARKIRYGVRNARVNAHSPVFRVLRACGVPMDPENGQESTTADTWVVHFPMRAPDGAVIAKEQTALDQLAMWKLNKLNYTTHNPSFTCEYGPDELLDVIGWVWENRSIIGGISFSPKSNSVYRQMPYEETSREEYERAAAAFPKIDWAMLAAFESEDQTTQAREAACTAGGCEAA